MTFNICFAKMIFIIFQFLELKKEQESQRIGLKSASALLKLRQSRVVEKILEQNKKLEETLEATLEDERHNMLEMKSLKENYESQIKILKRNCDKEVRKLVSSRGSLYINYGDHSISFPF